MIRLFAGRVTPLISGAAVWLSLWIIAHLAILHPSLADIDASALASWITGFLFVIINEVTNRLHLSFQDELAEALSTVQTKTSIPVKKAEKP